MCEIWGGGVPENRLGLIRPNLASSEQLILLTRQSWYRRSGATAQLRPRLV